MKTTILFISFFLTLSFLGCDSKAKKESALKNLELSQTMISTFQQDVDRLSESIKNSRIELEVAKDNAQNAKTPQFMRTHEEREEAIRNAAANVQKLEDYIEKSNQKILVLNDSIMQIKIRINSLKEILKK
jgi:outer membrane murein-binding lipoprotein Lpp